MKTIIFPPSRTSLDPCRSKSMVSWSMKIDLISFLDHSDLHATNLQRGVFFKPDPYIKVSLIAGRLHKQLRTSSHFHHQEKRTNVIPNTVDDLETEMINLCLLSAVSSQMVQSIIYFPDVSHRSTGIRSEG